MTTADEAQLGLTRARADDGSELWVERALPGERLRVRLTHVGRRRRIARPVELLRASEHRVSPGCPHYERCGGCSLRHASLGWQRGVKRAKVARALGLPEAEVQPVLPSPRAAGYRALAKLVLGPGGRLGSYAPRSHEVVDMRGCPVHAPVIEAAADRVRAALAGRSPGWLRYVVLRASLSAEAVLATLVVRRLDAPGLPAFAQALRALPIKQLIAHRNDSPGNAIFGPGPDRLLFEDGPVIERVGPITQDLRSGAFAQVNPAAAGALYAKVAELAQPAGARVLDLYAGSGGIGLTLGAAGGREVVAVERVASAVDAARAAAPAAYAGPYRAICAPALEAPWSEPWDLVVLNPPRRGLEPGLSARLLANAPASIVYVSCNPDSLARDLAELRPAYHPDAVCPVDLFPHTDHVETVVYLRRR